MAALKKLFFIYFKIIITFAGFYLYKCVAAPIYKDKAI